MHGKICYLEIPAKTGEASADFYSSIFGWKVRKRGDGEIAFDDPAGVSGTWVKESDRTPDEHTRTYIMVDAINDTLTRIQVAGGRVLTPREDEVLDLIVRGSSNKEGAHRLGIATRTFEAHRAHIMEKLGARNAADLVRLALSETR